MLIALVMALSALAVWSSVRAMGRREREIGYEVALRKYSETVHPGITRKELEDYLRPRNTNFSWMFTAFGGRTTTQYAALVKIGEETAPWYCSEEYVWRGSRSFDRTRAVSDDRGLAPAAPSRLNVR